MRENPMEEKEFWGYLAGAALPEVFWELESVVLCGGLNCGKSKRVAKLHSFSLIDFMLSKSVMRFHLFLCCREKMFNERLETYSSNNAGSGKFTS